MNWRTEISAGTKRAAIAFTVTLFGLASLQLQAQSIAGHNSNAPVNYAADRIELQDRQNRVTLSGNVDIRQAGLRVNASRTLIDYSNNETLQIQRITATGGVTVSRGNERATGDVAIYDFNRRIITMSGNVRLRRGTDTLNGGRLIIDLESGVSSVDGRSSGGSRLTGDAHTNSSGNGRVSGSFSVPDK